MKNGARVKGKDSRNLEQQNYHKQKKGKKKVGDEERESTQKQKYIYRSNFRC